MIKFTVPLPAKCKLHLTPKGVTVSRRVTKGISFSKKVL